jgi:hypothetical protein
MEHTDFIHLNNIKNNDAIKYNYPFSCMRSRLWNFNPTDRCAKKLTFRGLNPRLSRGDLPSEVKLSAQRSVDSRRFIRN